MKIKHEIDVDQALESLKNTLGNSEKEKPKNDKDDIDYKEFRCRIKSKNGTDINIPGSFIGLCFGIIATKVIFEIVHTIIKDKR